MSAALHITANRTQREIVAVALDLAKKLAQDVASGARRLNLQSQPALDAIGSIAYVRGEFDKVLPSDETAKVEIHSAGARILRIALGLWGTKVLERDRQDQQLILATNVSKVHKEAQNLLDELSEQLRLPLVEIVALDASGDGESEAESREPAKARKPQITGARKKK